MHFYSLACLKEQSTRTHIYATFLQNCIFCFCKIIYVQVLSQLRICRTPLPLRSSHIYMKGAHCAKLNEKSIFRFIFFMIDCIYNLIVCHPNLQVCHQTNKIGLKVAKFTGNMCIPLKRIFQLFMQDLVFHICSIFIYGRISCLWLNSYIKIDHIQTQPYLKN